MKTPPDDLADRLLAASELILASSPPPRFDDVATEIGVARATLYYYFSGRDDLLSFILAEHVRRGAEVIAAAEGDGPAERLHDTVRRIVEFLGAEPSLCPALLGAMGASGRMADALEANERSIATPLRELVADGMRRGELAGGDPADVTNALIGAILLQIVGRSMRGLATTDDASIDAVASIARRVIGL
ncbi:MAG: TetR/AcrR family transcriptional regulator [Acidimicrobiales bacterium]